jgi:hypothetical protein
MLIYKEKYSNVSWPFKRRTLSSHYFNSKLNVHNLYYITYLNLYSKKSTDKQKIFPSSSYVSMAYAGGKELKTQT